MAFNTRIPQIRYTQEVSDRWTWAVAVENPNMGISNPLGSAGVTQANTPELIGRIRWENTESRDHVQFALTTNRLRWGFDDGSDAATAMRYGGNLTGNFVFGNRERWMVTFGVGGGQGMATWSPTLGGADLDAVLRADGELEVLPMLEYNGGFRYSWSQKWSSAFLWAQDFVWLDASQDPDTFDDGGSFHVNLLWTPAKSVLTGVEYIWGYRETMDGRRGEADRVQVSLKWQFNP